MIRVHKIRLNPTIEQEIYLKRACGVARFTFNWALAEWKRQKSEGVKNSDPVNVLKREFNAIKHDQFPWVGDVAKSAAESGFFNLKQALSNYFQSKSGKRKGKPVGFPKFKSKKRASLSFAMAYDAVKNTNYIGHDFYLPKMANPINMTECLRFVGTVKESVVSYSSGYWWVAVRLECEAPAPINHQVVSVGIDLGLKTLATLSDGKEFENQKFLRKELTKLKRLGRQASRRSVLHKLRKANPTATQNQILGLYRAATIEAKQEGRHVESKRWLKAQKKLQRMHYRIASQRSYALHSMTKQIATTYKVIGVENLNIKGMMSNRRLALSVADASMAEILRQLKYKAAQYGGRVIPVGRFYASSKTCSDCGYKNNELVLSDRTWICQGCGIIHDRDFNASVNIHAEALRLMGA